MPQPNLVSLNVDSGRTEVWSPRFYEILRQWPYHKDRQQDTASWPFVKVSRFILEVVGVELTGII